MRHPTSLLFFPFLLAFVLASACADSAGRPCKTNGDCDDDEICAPQVDGCSDPDGCFGICGRPCMSEEDCGNDAICERSAEPGIAICRDTPAPGG